MNKILFILAFATIVNCSSQSAESDSKSDADSFQRGKSLYSIYCIPCHQENGQGLEAVFPPLAHSDFLLSDKNRSIRILQNGLNGPISVNGKSYTGSMPSPGLKDEQIADVLTYVRQAWENEGDSVSLQEVLDEKANQEALRAATGSPAYAPLPSAPAGMKLQEAIRLDESALRLASDGISPWIFLLSGEGNLQRFDPKLKKLDTVLRKESYLETTSISNKVHGILIDSKRRMYIVANQVIEASPWPLNLVSIYRSEPLKDDGTPRNVKLWFRTAYPFNNGGFAHLVNCLTEGPDGMIYINSGSRTDSGERAQYPNWFNGGETEITSSIWQMDPEAETPKIKLFAQGTRNAWSFCWTPENELLAIDNGPQAHAPEELNLIEEGKHYGFPYVFGNLLATDEYHHGLPIPEGLTLTPPIQNFGPDGGGSAENPISSFDPHSSPAGFIYCDDSFPDNLKGSYLIGRVGSMNQGWDTGFDILKVDLKKNDAGIYESRMKTFLAPLSRPVDMIKANGRVYILEFNRQNSQASAFSGVGRLLELSWD